MLANTIKQPAIATVSLVELFRVFLKIGLLSFGGPAAQISLMHSTLVDNKKWLTEAQFLNALGFCMLLPGPEAMQLATYAGWRLRGIVGGLIAGLLFVIPGALVILTLAILYMRYADLYLVDTLFLGVKAAVIAIVLQALLRIAGKALHHKAHWAIALSAFVALFFFALPFPLVILFAGLYGFCFYDRQQITPDAKTCQAVSVRSSIVTAGLGSIIWLLPLVLLAQFSDSPLLVELGSFFAKLAVVTFGGAYAVLVYMAQDVVTNFGWLSAGEMIDGLGLAETTPGPLILVTEFVAFITGFNEGGIGLGIAAASLTLWVTFVPCFIWIFVGAPYIEWLFSQSRLKSALAAITAAVVGVIMNLSLWFSLHVLFSHVSQSTFGPIVLWQPQLSSINLLALGLSLLSVFLLFKLRFSVLQLLACGAILSWGFSSVSTFA